jgi:hypothetical protein
VTSLRYSLLKTVRLLCITISVGRSRSVKNVADTKLFAARSLQKASTDVFQGPPPQQCTKRRPQNQEGLNCKHSSPAFISGRKNILKKTARYEKMG